MSALVNVARGARVVAFIAAALLVAACARTPGGADRTGGASLSLSGAKPGSSQDFVVNVGDRVFFETDSTNLTATAVETLNKQVTWLNQYGRYAFTIEGHADERGTREYNIALGARRAETVRNYFIAHGIAANRMRTISYGKERPVAVCDDISCWSQNRRAVVVLDNAGV
ncbi:MAG: peptidoglycan-associated lipoprotein Pal [Rhizobiales bacterium]|nr:peptidoglycan-associated lipoprotein Pal [Hyphomicrobiales bacterium]